MHLKRTAERARGASGGVRLVPRRLAPRDPAVAAGADLAAGHDQLQAPQVRVLLPQHEPSHLPPATPSLNINNAPLLAAAPVHDAAVVPVELRCRHPHLPHRVHAAHPAYRFFPSHRHRRRVLLHYVLRPQNLLLINRNYQQ